MFDIESKGLACRSTFTPRSGANSNYFYGNVATILIGGFMFGYAMSAMNASIANIAMSFQWCGTLQSKVHLPIDNWPPMVITHCERSTWYQNWVNSSLFIGAAIGCLIAGSLSRFGRRRMLMHVDVLFIIVSLLTACATGIETLVVCRFVTGLATGAVSCLGPMFLSEVVPKDERGKWGSAHEVLIACGILTSITIGVFQNLPDMSLMATLQMSTLDANWWRVVQMFLAVPAMLQLFLLSTVFTTESPMYLVSQNRMSQAEALLTQLGRPLSSVDAELQELRHIAENDKRALGLVQALQSRKYRYGLFVGGMLSAIQQLSGINLLTTTSHEIFLKAGLSNSNVHYAANCVALISIPMCVVAAKYCDTMGRRVLLLWGLMGMSVGMGSGYVGSLFGETVFSLASVLGVYIYAIFFFMSLGPICWIYISEIYPQEVRGAGVGFASSVNWIMTFIVVFAVKFMSLPTIFAVLTVTNLCSLWWVHRYIVETKGTSIERCPLYEGLEG